MLGSAKDFNKSVDFRISARVQWRRFSTIGDVCIFALHDMDRDTSLRRDLNDGVNPTVIGTVCEVYFAILAKLSPNLPVDESLVN